MANRIDLFIDRSSSLNNHRASLYYSDMLLLFILLLISGVVVVYRRRLPVTNWPVLGMTPDIILNTHRIQDFFTDLVKLSNATVMLRGPWFANINMLLTSDPSNIHYILSKNFPNYPKGPEFRKMFDILGDGIFNSDHELWEIHRKATMSLLKHADFQALLETTIVNKIENGIFPVLEFASTRNQEIDLQEIFQRFTFDVICLLLLGYDPESLSIDLPFIPCEKAFTDAEEALLWRHVLPENVWKLQRRFGLGKEKKMNEATTAFDEFIYKYMYNKHDEAVGMVHDKETGFLTSLVRGFEGKSGMPRDIRKFSRDTIFSLMVAGRDTTSTALSWFFYLLAKNPSVELKIRAEIGEKWGVKELEGLIYLHGGICEALRLYPPVALEHKAPLEADVLPSGHVVDANTRIILCFYSMGRMEDIWGEDCMEFNPERWFTKDGRIKHEPSYKFTAFHAGPRTCLGKEMGLVQIKMVVAWIISRYHVELVKGHKVCPSDSVILQMKYGLKVKLSPINNILNQ